MIQAARIKEDSGIFSLLRIKMPAASDPSTTIELHWEYKRPLRDSWDLYFQRDDNFNLTLNVSSILLIFSF